MSTICIVQARMGSSRFPEKAIKKISRFMLIEWVLKRVKKSKKIKKIVLATTNLKQDDKLIKIPHTK